MKESSRRRRAGRIAAAVAVAVSATLVAIGCDRPGSEAASSSAAAGASETAPARVETLYGACVLAMLQSTCRVTNDKSGPTPSADTVFVAGVGPVDAVSYRQLRDSGEAMCQNMRRHCTAAWDGAQCFTARALWSGVAATR